MLIKVSNYELYSHRLETTEEWDEDEIFAFIQKNEIVSYDELLELIEGHIKDLYLDGLITLEGEVGDGSWYDGNKNEGHSIADIEFEVDDELEEKLVAYFKEKLVPPA